MIVRRHNQFHSILVDKQKNENLQIKFCLVLWYGHVSTRILGYSTTADKINNKVHCTKINSKNNYRRGRGLSPVDCFANTNRNPYIITHVRLVLYYFMESLDTSFKFITFMLIKMQVPILNIYIYNYLSALKQFMYYVIICILNIYEYKVLFWMWYIGNTFIAFKQIIY